jgi:hypothetical protein
MPPTDTAAKADRNQARSDPLRAKLRRRRLASGAANDQKRRNLRKFRWPLRTASLPAIRA